MPKSVSLPYSGPARAVHFLSGVGGWNAKSPRVDGSISMARGAVGTASTEFFICIGAQPALDFGGSRNADGQGFAVFGRVTAGMDVVRAIHSAPADAPTEFEYFRGQLLEEPVVIEAVTRVSP